MPAADPSAQIASARPEITAAIMTETGLDDGILRGLVHSFYDRVRRDAVLGPYLRRGSPTGGRIWNAWWRSGPRSG